MRTAVDIYGGRLPIDIPAYPPAVAAHHLRLPIGNVRYWALGRTPAKPVIRIADPAHRLLSFRNLVEIHVLSAVTRQYGVKLRAVRSAVRYLEERLGVEHPLTNEAMQTDGVSLFVERFDKLIDASRDGQVAMRDCLTAHLQRVRWDSKGLPVQLFPFTRASRAPSPESVVIDPRVQFGRPCIKGTGVPTAVVVERFQAGDEVGTLAREYFVSPKDIHEAIRYETRQAA